ncbi:MAG TPA: aminopeptidase P family protein, partial [Devosia sp.]|nr:aminopeptidase P family protein [Devosia sp.]
MRIELEPTLYQSFEDISDPSNVAPRIASLRAKMAEAGIDAFLVPLADAHRGESLPDSEQRLAYISGFTGSAGIAIVSKNKAALFVDGRYTLQAPAQTDTSIFEVLKVPDDKLNDWIINNLPDGAKLGFDPWLHTPDEVKNLNKIPAEKCTPVPVKNLIDAIWNDRPAPPKGEVEMLGTNRAGISREDKLADLQQILSEENTDTLVLTLPESINWLFNIRGRDVPNTPVVLGFAIVPKTGKPSLFIDQEKLNKTQIDQLSTFLDIVPEDQFAEALKTLGTNGARVWVDPASCPNAVLDILAEGGACLIKKTDPNILPKAIKNAAELAGMREAHRLDGIAMAKFLCWFDLHCETGLLSEIDIASALEAFRRQESTLVDISFDTISGSGPNGAIVHYRVTNSSNRKLIPGELMLVDSGGQYLSGTTDITRTMFTGSVTTEQKDHNTRVLKGMIAITIMQFLPKTTGAHLDVLARQFLWQVGLNYNHGTGHGVGAFLSVHEGPASISPLNNVKLEKGMILSNEPGYYLEGEYGIRI